MATNNKNSYSSLRGLPLDIREELHQCKKRARAKIWNHTKAKGNQDSALLSTFQELICGIDQKRVAEELTDSEYISMINQFLSDHEISKVYKDLPPAEMDKILRFKTLAKQQVRNESRKKNAPSLMIEFNNHVEKIDEQIYNEGLPFSEYTASINAFLDSRGIIAVRDERKKKRPKAGKKKIGDVVEGFLLIEEFPDSGTGKLRRIGKCQRCGLEKLLPAEIKQTRPCKCRKPPPELKKEKEKETSYPMNFYVKVFGETADYVPINKDPLMYLAGTLTRKQLQYSREYFIHHKTFFEIGLAANCTKQSVFGTISCALRKVKSKRDSLFTQS